MHVMYSLGHESPGCCCIGTSLERHHGYVIWGYVVAAAMAAGSARREAVLWLPSQPWKNKHVCSFYSSSSLLQPLSSSLANPAFSEQCTQWETTRQSASQTRSVIQDYCVYFSGKMFFSNTLDAKWPIVWKIP